MTRFAQRAVRWLALCVFLLAGCATAPKPSAPADLASGPWSGRLALQLKDQPGDAFSAGFQLKGSAKTGELSLYSPIGGTLAVLSWQPGHAVLRSSSKTREFDSVDALVAQVAGAAIPVGALFDWLRGIDTPVAGWRADLSQLAQGRIAAKRYEPAPEADLRVVLER
jgi:outer membrane lipoprotein LolB